MSWLQLDPSTHAARIQASGVPVCIPSLAASVTRGILGFTVVSLAGFTPWVVWGRALARQFGEAGLYTICALLFIGLSAPLLHRLILGPGSLRRFYALFSVAFAGYSVAWMVGWMTLRGHLGGVVGLLAGTALMGWICAAVFRAYRELLAIITLLFLCNAAGYFLGDIVEGWLLHQGGQAFPRTPQEHATQMFCAKLQWGACYGVGLGAGLGAAFHLCQRRVRALLGAPATTA